MKTADRNLSLDTLKVVLALMVVGLHAEFLRDVSLFGCFVTMNGLFRIAVPVFFVINGFYFFTVLQGGGEMRWLKRVIILYVFWMTFYAYYWVSYDEYTLFTFAEIAKNLVLGYYHLWYLPGIFGAASLVFLMRRCSSGKMVVISLLLYTVGLGMQYAGNYHLLNTNALDRICNTTWLYRNFLFFAFPLFCIGYLLNKHSIIDVMSRKKLWILTGFGMLLLACECLANYIAIPEFQDFDLYGSLLIICPALFLLVQKLELHGSVKTLAWYSSAIYFIHPLFILLLQRLTSLSQTPVTFIAIAASVLVSPALIAVNRKINVVL